MLIIKRDIAQSILDYLASEPHLYTRVHKLIQGIQQAIPIDQYLAQYESEKTKNLGSKSSENIALVPED